jgi:hypothetical protein
MKTLPVWAALEFGALQDREGLIADKTDALAGHMFVSLRAMLYSRRRTEP